MAATLALTQELLDGGLSSKAAHVWLITQGAQAVSNKHEAKRQPQQVLQSWVSGFVKSVRGEHPELQLMQFDLDSDEDVEAPLARLLLQQ
eukprot:33322-Eustigmatos_ZCMA.PRE.1